MIKQTTWFRPVLACLSILILGVAACNAPTEYEVEMGQHLKLTMNDTAKYDEAGDLFAQLEEAVAFAEAYPGVESVSISVNEEDGGPVTVDLMAWGQTLDGEALTVALQAEFPALAGAEITIEPLAGTVEGNLGQAFGHAVFDLEVEGETAEEIRASILQQIYEHGFTGDAVVEVLEADGVQTINIDLNDIQEDGSGTEDTVIIELQED